MVRFLRLFLLSAALLMAGNSWASPAPDYLRQVKPLLQARCYSCHGALKQKGLLRLDTADSLIKGGESGAAILPGNAPGSLLIAKVSAQDIDERMPPEHEGEPFKPAEVQLLSDWIAAGAAAPADEKPEADPREHWAFRTPVRPAVPEAGGTWGKNPIDMFISQQHQQQHLTPQAEAPREVLQRRLFLDLIGLPPTLQDIAGMEQDNPQQWYETLVDRLLADPRHGERWARHWMDIWRYSDWWGLGDQLRNSQKHIWHWRDWIVESLNADASYAGMIRLMLAADESHPGELEKLRATGFLARNFFLFNRQPWMEETVEHVSKGFLGLTMNCAKCHDHKYDPVSQQDYYRMRAFFEPYQVRLDMVPGETDLERDGIPRVFDGLPDEPTWRFIRGDESKPDKSKPMTPGVPALLASHDLGIAPVPLLPVSWQPGRQPWVVDSHIAAARKNLESAEAAFAQCDGSTKSDLAQAKRKSAASAVVSARATVRNNESRGAAVRASWERPGGDLQKTQEAVVSERETAVAVARQALAAKEVQLLEAPPDKTGTLRKELKACREACDQALIAAAEPLRPGDTYSPMTGAKWTPTRFRSSSSDDPDIPFPAQSTGRRLALAGWISDKGNPLTARVAVNHLWSRHMGTPLVATVFDFGRKGARPTHPELLDWLAVEFMEHGWSMKHLHRLIVTSAAYRMSSSLLGAGASASQDPDNRHLWRRLPIRLEAEVVRDSILSLTGELDASIGGPPVPPGNQEKSTRRSLYFFHSNNERNLLLTSFDGAAVKECYRRDQSIVPQQALALSNSRLVQEGAAGIARRLEESGFSEETEFIQQAWKLILAIHPSGPELSACHHALAEWRRLEPEAPPTAAKTHLIWTLLNHNDFVTLR